MDRNHNPEGCLRQRLEQLLLNYLLAAGLPRWPGSDSVTVQEILDGYPVAATTGRVPDAAELVRRHPDLAEEVTAYFARLRKLVR